MASWILVTLRVCRRPTHEINLWEYNLSNDILGILTNPEDVEDFIAAGVDFLAPSVGNIHGDYGPKGPQLDMDR
jgi:hypothetical protein